MIDPIASHARQLPRHGVATTAFRVDADNTVPPYYVARANAVTLHFTRNDRRNSIEYAGGPVARDRWHVLRVCGWGSK